MKFKCQWNDNDENLSSRRNVAIAILQFYFSFAIFFVCSFAGPLFLLACFGDPNIRKWNWHCSWHVALEMFGANVRWFIESSIKWVLWIRSNYVLIQQENKSKRLLITLMMIIISYFMSFFCSLCEILPFSHSSYDWDRWELQHTQRCIDKREKKKL